MAFKQKKYIPQGARGWKSKVKVPAWSGEGPFLGFKWTGSIINIADDILSKSCDFVHSVLLSDLS